MLQHHDAFEPSAETFIELACRNPYNRAVLERLHELEVPDTWLVAGCLYQTVWNVLSDRPVTENIKDYDIFYFDDRDTSYEAEDRVIQRARSVFWDLDIEIEVRNQARVHLWYEKRFGHPHVPLESSRHGISSFLVRGTCVAIAPDDAGGMRAESPYGLAEMFDGVLRANRPHAKPDLFAAKAASYQARWPWLRIVEWGAQDVTAG
jgi:hypothetical protein